MSVCKQDVFNRRPRKEPMKRVSGFSHHEIKHIKRAPITSKGTVSSIKIGWMYYCSGQGRPTFLDCIKSPLRDKNEMLGVWCWITDLLATASSPEMQTNFFFLLFFYCWQDYNKIFLILCSFHSVVCDYPTSGQILLPKSWLYIHRPAFPLIDQPGIKHYYSMFSYMPILPGKLLCIT